MFLHLQLVAVVVVLYDYFDVNHGKYVVDEIECLSDSAGVVSVFFRRRSSNGSRTKGKNQRSNMVNYCGCRSYYVYRLY